VCKSRTGVHIGKLTGSESELIRVTLRLAIYRQSVRLGAEPLETHDQNFLSQLNTCGRSPYITSSLTKGWVCHLQVLLALASAFFSGPSPVGLATIFYCLRFETSFSVASYDSQGWYSTPPPHGNNHVTERLKAGIVKSEETSIARQCFAKHIPVATWISNFIFVTL
jgi:hypothetical protein